MSCSTCDDYQLVVPGEDGMLVRCLDCVRMIECPVHGSQTMTLPGVAGRCVACVKEAAVAEAQLRDAPPGTRAVLA